jgi:Bacterial protein of unknown function (Gcw_chp)
MDGAFVKSAVAPVCAKRGAGCDAIKNLLRQDRCFCTTVRSVMKATTKVLSALSLLALAGAAQAEVTGSMGIASTYLWRGYDLGSGTPAVSGDLKLTAGGFYTGAWVSSGDTVGGTEYDLYAGWGATLGPVTLDLSYWTYSYPTSLGYPDDGGDHLGPGELSDFVASVGFGPISVFAIMNATNDQLNAGDTEGEIAYYGVKAKFGSFSGVLAQHTEKAGIDELLHADLTYSYNDNLSFTLSAPLDSASGNEADPTIVVSYAVPFGK